MILLVIASLISCQALGDAILIKSSKSAIRIKRVVGGNFTDILMNPWLASIQLNGIHICGGSILSETIILTAAHCAYEYSPDKLSVRVGSSDSTVGGSKHDVMSSKIHGDYEKCREYTLNDLALLKLHLIQALAGATHASPLMLDGSQVGLVSWSFGCANPKYPTVYTNVIFYRDWIDKFSQNFNADEEEKEAQ